MADDQIADVFVIRDPDGTEHPVIGHLTISWGFDEPQVSCQPPLMPGQKLVHVPTQRVFWVQPDI